MRVQLSLSQQKVCHYFRHSLIVSICRIEYDIIYIVFFRITAMIIFAYFSFYWFLIHNCPHDYVGKLNILYYSLSHDICNRLYDFFLILYYGYSLFIMLVFARILRHTHCDSRFQFTLPINYDGA